MQTYDVISLRTMLNDADPYVRRDACEYISESRSVEFIPSLVGVLSDENAGVKEAALNALTSIGGRPVAEAVAPLLRLDDASLRNIGIEILQQIGPDAVGTLNILLNDRDYDVVKFAVDILSAMNEKKAAEMLAGLVDHPNPNIKASVAVCLGRIMAPGSVNVLLKILGDSEEWVRFSAIEGLGLLQDRRALGPLAAIVETDSGILREAAVEAISKIASPEDAADVLLKLEGVIRRGGIVNPASIVELMEKASLPGSDFRATADFKKTYFRFFANAVEEGDRPVRLKALRGLGLLKLQEGLSFVYRFANSLNELDEETEAILIETIVSVAGHGALPQVVKDELKRGSRSLKITVRALSELKSEEAVPLLAALLNNAAKHELREAVSALEAIGSPDSIDVLFKALKSSDGHVRKISARALACLAGEPAVGALFEILMKETYRDVMEGITDGLAVIPSDAVKRGFCALLSSEREELREMGARGLGLIGDEEALRSLEEAALDISPNVRKVAYKSMARLGIPEAAGFIIKGLKDQDDDVKLSVLKALGGWTGESIRAALLEALKDRNIWVRYHSVLLLGDMGEPENEPYIIDRLKKDEAPVKAAAAKALEKLGSEESVKVLEEFLNHPDQTVRGAVEGAIESLKC